LLETRFGALRVPLHPLVPFEFLNVRVARADNDHSLVLQHALIAASFQTQSRWNSPGDSLMSNVDLKRVSLKAIAADKWVLLASVLGTELAFLCGAGSLRTQECGRGHFKKTPQRDIKVV
jgi:hypothetical protein